MKKGNSNNTGNNVIKASLLLLVFGLISISASVIVDGKWEVPASVKNMKNPTDPNDAEGKAVGKTLYMKHCKSCHGKTGEGDGPKAAELDDDCGDFTTEEFQASTDGEVFYKTKEGRDDMPSFKKKIQDDEDVWLIVNYLRTFGE